MTYQDKVPFEIAMNITNPAHRFLIKRRDLIRYLQSSEGCWINPEALSDDKFDIQDIAGVIFDNYNLNIIEQIVENLPNIKTLVLKSDKEHFDHFKIFTILKGLRKLETLSVSCKSYSPRLILKFLKNHPTIINIVINGVMKLKQLTYVLKNQLLLAKGICSTMDLVRGQ